MNFDFQKASQSFDSLPFKERFKAVGNLVKNTFSVIGRDEDIIKPWIRMAVYNFVMVTAFFYGIMGWWYEFPFEGWAVFLAILLFIYKHFYHNRQEVRMSWTVYETIIGNDPSYKGATKASKGMKSQTRRLAWMDIGMGFVQKGKYVGGGLTVILINLFISGLEEVWDLVNHYLLPSVAVDKLDITPGVKKMKKLKDQVPESLVGVFGIDFIGDVVRRIMVPTYILLVIGAGLMGYFGADFFPATTIELGGEDVAFTWVPLIMAVYVGKLFSNLLERTVTSIKVIYFTVFYTKITHPERIMEELQEELVDYLKLEQVNEVEDLEGPGAPQPAPA